jgi:uncharacterized membrane protein YidH (DUF202 family)
VGDNVAAAAASGFDQRINAAGERTLFAQIQRL